MAPGSGTAVQRPQEAIRLVVRRASRALFRDSASCAGRFGAVPKYISSGVWPRNAAWGILVLCSSTKNATSERRCSMVSRELR